ALASRSCNPLPRRPQAACIEDRVAARLSRGERIHECVQALDRKGAEPDADNWRLVSPKPTHCARLPAVSTMRHGPSSHDDGKRLVFTFLTHSVLIGFPRPQPRTTPSRYSCLFSYATLLATISNCGALPGASLSSGAIRGLSVIAATL